MELAPEVKRVFEYFNPDLDVMDEENDDVTSKINEINSLVSQLPLLRGFAELKPKFTGLAIAKMRGVEHAREVLQYAYPTTFSSSEYYKMPLKSLSLVVSEVAAVFNEDKRKSYNYKSVEEYAKQLFDLTEYTEMSL